MIRGELSMVKVFSATKAKDRELLGDRVTAWIAEHREVQILNTIVALTSDLHFHCLSIVMLCADRRV